MKKGEIFMFFLISVILFNIFFLVILIYYNHITILSGEFLKNITKEYYFSYMNNPATESELIIVLTYFVKLIFSLIFPLEFLYIIFNKEYMRIIGKKSVITSLIIGFIANCLSSLFIIYEVEHYKLFMHLISTEISSLVLLSLILRFKKQNIVQLR